MTATKKCALLIAAGQIPEKIFKKLCTDEKYSIAIDGGYNSCINSGFIPDVVIGDFDSLDQSLINESVISIHQTSQEETDLFKAIKWTISKDIKDIEIIGVESGRSDHILGTYAALAELNQEEMLSINLRIHLNDFVVTYIPQNRNFEFNFENKTHLSLFCFSKSIVSLKGVEWELDKEKMDFSTRGIHNYSKNKKVEFFIHSGGPALFFIRR